VLASGGLQALVLFGMRTSPDVYHALVWEKGIHVTFYVTFLFYYHFTLAYTHNRGQRRLLLASYLVLLIFVAITPTNLVIQGMRLEDYGYAPVLGPLAFPVSIGGIALMAGGAYNLLRRYKVSSSYEERNRMLYLTIAIFFPLAGALLDGFSNLPPMAIWGILIFCIICSIAIVKYHLLDIRFIIRKSLVYLLISALVAIPYAGVIILLFHTLKTALEQWWAHGFIILLLAIILSPLYSWAQQLVDRLFYRDRYNYLKALERFSLETQSVTNLGELASMMVRLVSGALRTVGVCLLLPSESKHGLVVASSTGLDPSSGVVLRGNSPLVKWLELHGDILSSEQLSIVPQLQSLSLKERNNLQRMGAKLYASLKTRQGQLSGILVLGQKLSEQSYSIEDKQLLTAVSNQMAIALDNARLYQETRQSEKELRKRESEYRELAESITDIFFAMNKELKYTYWNRASEELTGISAKDALGKHLYDIFPDTKATRRAEELYLKVLTTRQPQHLITGYSFGGTDFVFEISAYPSKGGISVFVKNITERKQAEEREKKLQQELNLSSRLAAIGELAAGVAHEINNPLTGIMGFSQRLLRKSADEKTKQYSERIHEEACRAAKVVENLRAFARRSEPKKEWLDVNDVLQKVTEMRIYELNTSNIEVISHLAFGLPWIMADYHQIQQVFLNILINSEQAISETYRGGKLVIRTQEHEGYIRITFTDNGPGIVKENLDKLFDPFFTTRGEKGGTGLGLGICHSIVTDHGGRIYARSKRSKGATFVIELPMTTK